MFSMIATFGQNHHHINGYRAHHGVHIREMGYRKILSNFFGFFSNHIAHRDQFRVAYLL